MDTYSCLCVFFFFFFFFFTLGEREKETDTERDRLKQTAKEVMDNNAVLINRNVCRRDTSSVCFGRKRVARWLRRDCFRCELRLNCGQVQKPQACWTVCKECDADSCTCDTGRHGDSCIIYWVPVASSSGTGQICEKAICAESVVLACYLLSSASSTAATTTTTATTTTATTTSQTFRRALTASVDSCAEIKSAPSVAYVTKSGRVWRKVPKSDACWEYATSHYTTTTSVF